MTIGSIVRGALDLLAPPTCPACDAIVPPGPPRFCDGCVLLLDPLFAEGYSDAAYRYEGPMADAIRRFKYGGRSELSVPLSARLAAAAHTFAGHVDLVVTVPPHPARLRARGFDQVALLARPVALVLGVPLRLEVLSRTRHTRPQASLDVVARAANVRGAFAARQVAGVPLLVDDVRTSGSTLFECATALRSAGATAVKTLVLARAEP